MISDTKFEQVLETLRAMENDTLSGSELSYLENLVRESSIVTQKVYNYMSKGYITFTVIDNQKRIDKQEAERYLRKCRTVKSSQFKETFTALLND